MRKAVITFIIASFAFLTINISSVGATTPAVKSWYTQLGKSQIASLSKEIKTLNKNIAKPQGYTFGLACQELGSGAVEAKGLPQIPNKKLEAEWTTMSSAIASVGTNCLSANVYATGGASVTTYINAVKLYALTGNQMLVKINKQLK